MLASLNNILLIVVKRVGLVGVKVFLSQLVLLVTIYMYGMQGLSTFICKYIFMPGKNRRNGKIHNELLGIVVFRMMPISMC